MDHDLIKILSSSIRSVEQRGVENLNADYPFMMSDGKIFAIVCDALINAAKKLEIDFVAGIEATGLPFAGVLTKAFNKGLIMIRKENKLPGEVIMSDEFALPYKNQRIRLEIQKDIDLTNKIVLLFDEAIDTGNTLKAAVKLLYKAGAKKVIILTITNYPALKEIESAEVISLVYGQY